MTQGFDYSGIFTADERANADKEMRLQGYSAGRIEITFDYDYPPMKFMTVLAEITYWLLLLFLVCQFVLLICKKSGLFTFWTFIEYAQLVSYMPLLSARYLPYLYESFKTFLVSHLIFARGTIYPNANKDYFSKSYYFYGLDNSKLIQSLTLYSILFFCIGMTNILVYVLKRKEVGGERIQKFVKWAAAQFKFNVYIRFLMFSYIDLAFLSAVRVFNSDQSTAILKLGMVGGIVILILTFALPIIIVTLLFLKFDKLKEKKFKTRFNSLLLKIDKGTKWRVFNPVFFFVRRWLFALILVMSLESQAVFLQYIILLVFSCIYLLYLFSYEPYSTFQQNMLVISMEMLFLVLICCSFMYSDATPDVSVKFTNGVIVCMTMILMLCVNIAGTLFVLIKGKAAIKQMTKEQKERRKEQEEELQRERDERAEAKRREEEEWNLL